MSIVLFFKIERYKERILSALMQGLDDSEAFAQPGIIIQSLTGLSKMLPFLNNEKYESVCTSMAIRIKPFFEKVKIIQLLKKKQTKYSPNHLYNLFKVYIVSFFYFK